jgi:aldose sugar dehydrogenase
VETVAEHLEVPWAIAFLPDGRILVTERPVRIRVIKDGKLLSEPFAVIKEVEPSGESGLMDLTLHPRFDENHYLYLAYAYKEGEQFVRVVRYTERNNQILEPKVLVEKIPGCIPSCWNASTIWT